MWVRLLLTLSLLTLLVGTALAEGPHRLRSSGFAVDLYDEGDQIRIIVAGETWVYERTAGGGRMTGPEGGQQFERATDALTEWLVLQGEVEPEEAPEGGGGSLLGMLLALGGAFCLVSPRGALQVAAIGQARRAEPDDTVLKRVRSGGGLALVAGLLLIFL